MVELYTELVFLVHVFMIAHKNNTTFIKGNDEFLSIEPYNHHTNVPDDFIYNYCFCLKPEITPPDKDFSLSGLNFSRLDYDYVFLGAWNFKDVIANKEREFVENGGKFITHVPQIMVFS